MEITGTIVGRDGRIAQVMILRTSACGHDCETCGACAGKEHILLAEDRFGYPVGMSVVVQVSDQAPLGTAFAVYILPIILCGVLWSLFSVWLGMGWIGLVSGLGVWGVLLYYMNRKRGRAGVDGTVIGTAK